jgi:hypothetical protein
VKTKHKITATVALLFVLGALAWVVLRAPEPPEPVYQGKKLSAWLEVYDPTNMARPSAQLEATQVALREMGTNAIPSLLRMLRTPDSRWKNRFFALAREQHVIKISYVPPSSLYERAAMGLEALGPRAEVAVPELVKIFDHSPSPSAQGSIARVLGVMGRPAKAAVPSLLRGTASTDRFVRLNSIFALAQIHAEPALFVPVLVKTLQDPDPEFQLDAILYLGAYGPDAKPAVPALLDYLKRQNPAAPAPISGLPNINTGTLTLQMLKKIDPEAAAQVEVK